MTSTGGGATGHGSGTSLARRLAKAILVACLLTVVAQVLEYYGMFASAEGNVASVYARLGRPATQTPAKVVTIAIDDRDYEQFFNGASPLDQTAVACLVQSLRSQPVAALGVDLLTADWTPANRQCRDPLLVPVVWAASIEGAQMKPVPIWSWLLGEHEKLEVVVGKVLGQQLTPHDTRTDWGVPVFAPDGDRVLRRVHREWHTPGEASHHASTHTFARMVASAYCRNHQCAPDVEDGGKPQAERGHDGETFLVGVRAKEGITYTLGDLLTCQATSRESPRICHSWALKKDTENGKALDGAIVLLGGTFSAARDTYGSASGSSTAGLVLNAQAVRAELGGLIVSELPREFHIGIDVIVGVLVSFVLHVHGRPRRVGGFALIVAGSMVLSAWLFRWHSVLWLGWVTMILSGLAWHALVERLWDTPQPKAATPASGNG